MVLTVIFQHSSTGGEMSGAVVPQLHQGEGSHSQGCKILKRRWSFKKSCMKSPID